MQKYKKKKVCRKKKRKKTDIRKKVWKNWGTEEIMKKREEKLLIIKHCLVFKLNVKKASPTFTPCIG